MNCIDDPIKAVPGIGSVLVDEITAEISDLIRFKGHPQLASYFGIIPSMIDSKEFKKSCMKTLHFFT